MSLDNNILDFKVLTTVNFDRALQQAGVVTTDDPRLSDARTPLPHTHPTSDITGLDQVQATQDQRLSALEARPVSTQVNTLANYRQVGTSPVERWYLAGCNSAADLVSFSYSGNGLIAIPEVFPSTVTIDKISINVIAVNSGVTARFGFYESAGGFVDTTPGGLIADLGEVSIGTTGLKTLAVSQGLLGGKLYYFAMAVNAPAVQPAFRGVPRAALRPFLGVSNSLGTNQGQGWQNASFVYGALPPIFTSPTVLSNDLPAIAFHYSA